MNFMYTVTPLTIVYISISKNLSVITLDYKYRVYTLSSNNFAAPVSLILSLINFKIFNFLFLNISSTTMSPSSPKSKFINESYLRRLDL